MGLGLEGRALAAVALELGRLEQLDLAPARAHVARRCARTCSSIEWTLLDSRCRRSFASLRADATRARFASASRAAARFSSRKCARFRCRRAARSVRYAATSRRSRLPRAIACSLVAISRMVDHRPPLALRPPGLVVDD